ncbi:hypothetical protein VQH23_09115 [Pararoseomonas sp. SCSIO 73927]|uniref:hypothetical protein n=1 Tax=Pararoseomonas sp. SCSIO 73927 TaxID=3114537 RepID=UPI0030CC5059
MELNPVARWRTGLLLLALCLPGTAAASDTVQALIAGHRYAVPRALVDSPVASGGVMTDVLSMRLLWPGAVPLPPGHDTSYESGLMAVVVQDISPTTRVERLSRIPGQRARFLALWRDSTVDQLGLVPDFDLAALSLGDTEEASRLGLRALRPFAAIDPARELRLFADGPPARLSVLMACWTGLSCQLWWMEGEAAVEVTFTERFLPDWAAIRSAVTALLGRMRTGRGGVP